MISAQGITKSYNSKTVLSSVSIVAESRKITALLGPNGAGKTTLIRVIMGLIFPEEGKVEILGKDPFKDKSVFKRVGYIQELPNLPPFFSGRQLLEFSADIKGVDKKEIKRVIDLVGMEEHANKKIAKYSKGMMQRIAIAEALLGSPEILIMDEPNMGTDPILTLNFRKIVKEIAESGTTVLMTSHEMEDVKRMADQVYFLFRGKIYFSGTTEELVKRFLGVRVIIEISNLEGLEKVISEVEFVKSFEIEGNKVIATLTEDKREELLKRLILSGFKVKSFYLSNELEEAYFNVVKEASSSD
ncbi:antibiotic ABC transporter ATP-binding protein [Candidatus Acidianus copahuensis]|uniref:Antibiotic ABC transporter ATP-binding protein n=1 Tax=Candidatus Acidianus copahuensis TaxID=1160895 RepID=A0A031LLF0_9CREN|nr:ABC transporter ATP-binding protein [Candidatus Acidianus copahuensis]EZQ04887.1 antibiotic ABC transporter ATP-binding protein [Candidatus Acidianus copahuensis]